LNIRDLPPSDPLSTILFSSTTIGSNTFSGTHRVTTTTLTNAQRPIFGVEAAFTGVSLNPGSYWIDVNFNAGFAPPATVFDPIDNRAELVPGNALQFNGTTWSAVSDAGVQVTVPFQIQGTVVPEPTAICGVVLVGLLALRRHRRTGGR
jgi:hypothetical protein